MITIEIKDNSVEQKQSRNEKVGAYSIQTAYAHIVGEAYPVKCEWFIPRNQVAYAKGLYELGASSIVVDKDRRLSLGFPQLLLKGQPKS